MAANLTNVNNKPYTIERSDILGRYLVAKRDIKPGETILKEAPLLVGPRVDSDIICISCYKPLSAPTNQRCSRCRVAPICSVVCEKCGNHGEEECDALRRAAEKASTSGSFSVDILNNYQLILPLRCILLRQSAPDKWKSLLALEAHMEERRDAPIWRRHQASVVEVLRTWGLLASTEDDELQRVCGILDVNTFEVRGPLAVGVGPDRLRGVYLEAALMAHDCVGNTHLAVDDNYQMTIHASVQIPAGQPIYFNYTSTMQGTDIRREHLREGKYFECSCTRCTDPTELGTHMSSIICVRCHTGLVGRMTTDVWTCNSCSHKYRSYMIAAAVNEAHQLLENVDREDPREMELLLKKMSRNFSLNHAVMLEIKQCLIALYRDIILRESTPGRKILQRKIELCHELLPILEIIEPGISRLRGITLYELHVPIVILANREFQIGEITSSELLLRLKEGERYLREAVTQLLYEPTHTPESQLARVAMQDLKGLRQNMEDVERMEMDTILNLRKTGKGNKKRHNGKTKNKE